MNDRAGRGRFRLVVILLGLVLAGFVSFLCVKIVSYVSNPAPPFGFYYDLGVNAAATEYMVHEYASWRDFVDNLGWVGYGDVPNFFFNPELAYLSLVPLAKLLHDVWLSIKLVQVLEEVVAFFGAATLYSIYRKSRLWAAVAGILYATLPATALQVRGNIDIGWAIALTPLALGCGLRLARRFGEAALPVCGLLVSLCGFCFAAEYIFFTSLPAYAFIVCNVTRRQSRASGIAYALLGVLCIFGVGGYFLFPTLAGARLFTDPAARTNILVNGALLSLFSESWYGLLGLLPREFMISAYPQFNAFAGLRAVLPATAVLWLAAAGTAIGLVRTYRLRKMYVALAVAGVLLILSLGSTLPFGADLWAVLRALPGLTLVRTPDRFLALPVLLVVILGTAGLQALSERRGLALRLTSVALVTLAVGLFIRFDFAERWLTNENQVAYLEPGLALVNERVAATGGRTLSFAIVKGGNEFFTTSYGVPTPTLWYFWDITSHYFDDGLQGYGIFRRAAVRTVVATPDWSDNVDLPTSSRIDHDFPGPVLATSDAGVLVKKIGDGHTLSEMTSACVHGGPGLLDAADALVALRAVTFVGAAEPCSLEAYFDFDPGPQGVAVVARWDAGTLLPSAPPLLDADYPFSVGRVFINDPWYRNSVDGDESLSTGGAREITAPVAATLPLPQIRLQSARALAVRLASLTPARLTVSARDGRFETVTVLPSRGYRWTSVPLRALGNADALTLRIEPLGALAPLAPDGWKGIALDRVELVASQAAVAAYRYPASAALFTLAKFSGSPGSSPIPELAGLHVVASSGIFRASQSDEAYAAQGGAGTLTFRWDGLPGDYVLSAASLLRGPGAAVAIALGGGGRSGSGTAVAYDFIAQRSEKPSRTVTTSSDDPHDFVKHRTDVLLRAHLARGSVVRVRLFYPQAIAGASATLTALTVEPVGAPLRVRSDGSGRQSAIARASELLGSLSAVGAVQVAPGGIAGRAGSSIDNAFLAMSDAKSVTVRLTSMGRGDASVRLTCDGQSAESAVELPTTYVSVSGDRLRRCRTRIRWGTGNIAITALRIDYLGVRLPDERGRIWLPSGTFALGILQSGAKLRETTVTLDGRRTGRTLHLSSPGYHTVVVTGLSTSDRVLTFLASSEAMSRPRPVDSDRLSTFDWRVRIKRLGVLELASYPDGNWRLDKADGERGTASAIRCDLIDTCFSNVAPGLYRLHHLWPASLRLGLLVTCLTLATVVVASSLPRAVAALRARRLE